MDKSKNIKRDRWNDLRGEDAVQSAIDIMRTINSSRAELEVFGKILLLLSPQANETLLDVGSGTGDLLEYILKNVPDLQAVGVDLSADLLRYARNRLQNWVDAQRLIAVNADGARLPFESNRFDCAVCRWVLLHIAEPLAFIREIKRVVKPGGRIVCVEVDWESMLIHPGNKDIVRKIVRAHVDRQVDGQVGRKLKVWMRQAGLTNISVNPLVDMDSQGTPEWMHFIKTRAEKAVESKAILQVEADNLLDEISAAVTKGEFFFSFTQFAVYAICK